MERKVVQSTKIYSDRSEPLSTATPINGKSGPDKPTPSLERTKVETPLDILLSLLRPNELEKLQKYIKSLSENL